MVHLSVGSRQSAVASRIAVAVSSQESMTNANGTPCGIPVS